jgi:hypothetical protein
MMQPSYLKDEVRHCRPIQVKRPKNRRFLGSPEKNETEIPSHLL